MSSRNNSQLQSERLELLVIGQIFLTLGVACLSVGAAIGAAMFDDFSALTRAIAGMLVASVMVAGGELLSRIGRRGQDSWLTRLMHWTSTNLVSAGYFLGYFFIYSLSYVPGLQVLRDPYVTWVLGPVLAAVATWHGSWNRSIKYVTPLFTLLVTAHAMFQVMTNTTTVELGFMTVKVAALGCLGAALWCALLSRVYENFLSTCTWPGKSLEEAADYLINRVATELYFVLGALSAMAMPLVLGNLDQAPLWWSIIAPALLIISWKSATWYKHGIIGLMWTAAAITLGTTAFHHPVSLVVMLSVPLAGCIMSMAYRYRDSSMPQSLKVTGYAVYLYGGVMVALLVPYLQMHNVWDAMPYWLMSAVVLCAAALWLRDRVVHDTGLVTSMVSLVLFAIQWKSWNWGLVAPVIVGAYTLSLLYGYIARRGGWKQDDFLAVFPWTETVNEFSARWLENIWSWVGVSVLLAGTQLLIDPTEATIWWSVEAVALVVLGVLAGSRRYRLQSYLAFALAAGKVLFWNMLGKKLGLHNTDAFTLFRALEFTVFGASSVLAGMVHFYLEGRLEAEAKKNADDSNADGSDGDGPSSGGTDSGNTPEN